MCADETSTDKEDSKTVAELGAWPRGSLNFLFEVGIKLPFK